MKNLPPQICVPYKYGVLAPKIKASAYMLLMMLLAHDQSQDPEAPLSLSYLQRLMGLSRATVIAARKILVDFGLITTAQKNQEATFYKINHDWKIPPEWPIPDYIAEAVKEGRITLE